MHQLIQRQLPLTATATFAVVGQAPACIKRQAPAMHLQAAKQRLKPCQGCEHMQGIDLGEQLLDRPLRQHFITELSSGILVSPGSAEPSHNIRMRFVHQVGLRLRSPYRFQQRPVGSQARSAVADRGIAFHLTDHQHHPALSSRTTPRLRLEVVLGDGLLHQPLSQRRSPLALSRRPLLRRQERFQIAGPGGVVIDALVIHHPGHRIHQIRSQSNRAQKTVFHLEHRQLPARRGLEQPGFGAAAPDHHGINTVRNPPPWSTEAQLTSRQEAP